MSAWAISAPLLPDELFSSWLVRAALMQGCDPLVLTGDLWPKWRIWATDPDRGLSAARLSALVKASGIETSVFDTACLRAIASVVTTESLDDLAIWPWMLSLGSRNRRRHGGLQYCPSCLKEDRLPYYRVRWRMAWHTGCAKHEVYLIDRCPHCNAPIEPHRLSALDDDMAICATCKGDLREVSAMTTDSAAFAFQQGADQAVMHGQGRYGINSLSSDEWFALSRYFVMLLRKVALGKSDGLTTFVRALEVDVDAIVSPATGLALELLPVHERALLLVGAWQMLQAGPERFLEAARDSLLSAQSLQEKSSSVPRCIQSIVHQLADRRTSRMMREKANISNPRSQRAVMRMWARLQRKVGVASR
jgi:hypothetical protein